MQNQTTKIYLSIAYGKIRKWKIKNEVSKVCLYRYSYASFLQESMSVMLALPICYPHGKERVKPQSRQGCQILEVNTIKQQFLYCFVGSNNNNNILTLDQSLYYLDKFGQHINIDQISMLLQNLAMTVTALQYVLDVYSKLERKKDCNLKFNNSNYKYFIIIIVTVSKHFFGCKIRLGHICLSVGRTCYVKLELSQKMPK